MKFDAVLIAGPTASGKSAAALALAERLNGVVINADSMQVYAEAPILTAAPGAALRARVPHLLYGHVSVRDAYSTGRYAADAARALDEARTMGRIPIFTGGTRLYFTALPPFPPPSARPPARWLPRSGRRHCMRAWPNAIRQQRQAFAPPILSASPGRGRCWKPRADRWWNGSACKEPPCWLG